MSTLLSGVHKCPREEFCSLLTEQNQDRISMYAGVSFINQKRSTDYLTAFYYEEHSDI